jgi:CheY-like chemotaxis protein
VNKCQARELVSDFAKQLQFYFSALFLPLSRDRFMPDSPSQNAHKTILLVEDDEVVRMLTVEVLEELEYQVLQADNGIDALAIITSDQHLDLLMSDIGLPGMSGPQLMAAAHQLRPQLPVLFASGYAAQDYQTSASSAKVATITKPFSLDLLRTTVADMLA